MKFAVQHRGIHYFLIFALKHILLVLVRTHNICFEQKYEYSKKNQLKIVIFTAVKNRCILHGSVFIITRKGVVDPTTPLKLVCDILII